MIASLSENKQAANAFKDTRMDRFQSFADIFAIKELDEISPEDCSGLVGTVRLSWHFSGVDFFLLPKRNSSRPPATNANR